MTSKRRWNAPTSIPSSHFSCFWPFPRQRGFWSNCRRLMSPKPRIDCFWLKHLPTSGCRRRVSRWRCRWTPMASILFDTRWFGSPIVLLRFLWMRCHSVLKMVTPIPSAASMWQRDWPKVLVSQRPTLPWTMPKCISRWMRWSRRWCLSYYKLILRLCGNTTSMAYLCSTPHL